MDILDAILRKYVANDYDTNGKILGAAFIVVDRKNVLYSGSAGRIGFDAPSKPFKVDSFSWVASMTKLIATTCIMQLVEKSALHLDDDAAELVPELRQLKILRGFTNDGTPILECNTRPISLRMLLTHTAGLPYDIMDSETMKWSKVVGRDSTCIDWSMDGITTPLKFPPGAGWIYGTGFDWAGLVLERKSGKKLGEYMKEHVFDPLGMQDSGFWPEKLPHLAGRAVSSSCRIGTSLVPFELPLRKDHELESAGGGIFTTARDYARFQQAFLNGELLSQKSINLMFAPQLNDTQRTTLEGTIYNPDIHPSFGPEYPRGLKIDCGLGGLINLEDIPGKRRKGSMQWFGICNSRWWVDPVTGIAATLMVNVWPHGDPVSGALYDELESAVYEHLVRQ